jgi:hypothetical protein
VLIIETNHHWGFFLIKILNCASQHIGHVMLLQGHRYLYLTAAPASVPRPGRDPCPLDRHATNPHYPLPVLEGLCTARSRSNKYGSSSSSAHSHDTSSTYRTLKFLRQTYFSRITACAPVEIPGPKHIPSICRSGALTMNCWIKQP